MRITSSEKLQNLIQKEARNILPASDSTGLSQHGTIHPIPKSFTNFQKKLKMDIVGL